MPALLEPDLDNLAPPGNPDDFVVLEDRPVWKEHIARDGTKINRKALERVAGNCNRRIFETGDFAPLVIGHTKDDGSNAPEVIGFVGPYYVGEVGREKPKAAIYAKRIYVFKDDYHKLKKCPRLSVEYWADEDDPANGYFDPISALGAETPELDLGIQYQKIERDGKRLIRYHKRQRFEAECAPGGGNTFLPGAVEKRKKTPYEKGDSMLDESDIQRIVDAMDAVIDAKLEERMAALNAPPEDIVDPAAVPQEPPPEGAPMDAGMPGDVPADMPPDAGGDMPPIDDAPADLPADGPPDADLSDEPEDDEPEKYEAQRDLSSEGLNEAEATADAVGDMAAKAKKYRKERDDLHGRYSKLHAEHTALKQKYAKAESELEAVRAKERKAVRYAKLVELKDAGVQFDIDEEAEDTASMPEPVFERHLERMATRYSRIPLSGPLPSLKIDKNDGEPNEMKRERYAKQAEKLCLKEREAGREITYREAYDRVVAEDKQAVAIAP